tara:strand:+ start:446 stop:724 length:279 start_codon:yes stop_codon:yes gene_type:complete
MSKSTNEKIFDLKKKINTVIVENQKDIMTVERYVRILYAPARQPKDRLLDALDQIDNIHKERPSKQKKLRKMLDELYQLYSESPTLEIRELI